MLYDQLWHLAYLSPGTLAVPVHWGHVVSCLPAAVLKYSAVNNSYSGVPYYTRSHSSCPTALWKC